MITPQRHPREGGGPPQLSAIKRISMDSRLRGNDTTGGKYVLASREVFSEQPRRRG
ncbi:MAG: hypothetical protein H0X26_03990 [Alphaproteobacteria bacterium]|nr:hypothetical protein [Alphaproteobacteria bacterium]